MTDTTDIKKYTDRTYTREEAQGLIERASGFLEYGPEITLRGALPSGLVFHGRCHGATWPFSRAPRMRFVISV